MKYTLINTRDHSDEYDWEDSNNYFFDMMREIRDTYEKRYDTIVTWLFYGTVGVWTGNHDGGTIKGYNELFSTFSCDDMEVGGDEHHVMEFQYHHHDGTHIMNLYPITESKMKKAGVYGTYAAGDLNQLWVIEKLKGVSAPVKVPARYRPKKEVKK